ncbi:MAG: TetR/AcrR family transcriptional regulator [Bacteroidales bacterium]|nr:TetR/AcrR family transcriptional regulator [Bacteroidales bacterium]
MENSQDEFLKTVLQLYTKYGIRSVTMDDVARELGVSKKTLYTFVTDKNELVEKVIDFQCKERLAWMKSLNLDKLPALEEMVVVGKMTNKMVAEFNPSFHYDLSKYYGNIYNKMMRSNRESMAQSMLQNMKKGKKEGYYRQDMNEEIIVRMNIANIENLAEKRFYNSQEWKPEVIQSELFAYHIHAILSPKGLKEYQRLLQSEQNS